MKIHQLLKTRKQWIQGGLSRDKYGHDVSIHSKSAVCWCLYGALMKCYPRVEQYVIARKKLDAADLPGGSLNFITWNDIKGRKFSEIKELVKSLNV